MLTGMYGMFFGAASVNGDISKWDVSRVTDMGRLFASAVLFNCDLSHWDVSNVKDMVGMFRYAKSFDADLSKWDVSSVKNMNEMFFGASAFTQQLCTIAWVHSQASKDSMFEGSSGSISSTACEITTIAPAFSPQSRAELKGGVDAYVDASVKHDEQVHGSEATSPAARNDRGTFVCKPAVCVL